MKPKVGDYIKFKTEHLDGSPFVSEGLVETIGVDGNWFTIDLADSSGTYNVRLAEILNYSDPDVDGMANV